MTVLPGRAHALFAPTSPMPRASGLRLISAGVLALLALQAILSPSAHAQSAPSIDTWLPGPDAIGLLTYAGAIEHDPAPADGRLVGWVVDTSAQGWSGIDDVEVWDGLMTLGGKQITRAQIQVARDDVASALDNPYFAASGFIATVPGDVLSLGSLLYVYAHTPGKGWWYQLVIPSTAPPGVAHPVLQIQTPTALATVQSSRPFTARGFAYDAAASPAQGSGIDRVQLYLDGDRKTGIAIGDATLGDFDRFANGAGTQFARAGWQMTFQVSSWIPTVADNQFVNLTIYAHSSVTGAETMARTTLVISVP
ncbi:MAG: hypothetical protein NVSMB2_08230 [Chloroflexota bacterium]